jgi:hypothetical protein
MARICYYSLGKQIDDALGEVPKFSETVAMISYGDDNVFNFQEWFYDNNLLKEFCECYSKYGMTYTDCQKTGKPVQTTIDNVQFLKPSFAYSNKMMWTFAPIDIQDCLESVNWVKGCDRVLNCEERVENCLEELVQHGAKVYNEWRPLLVKACRFKNIKINDEAFTTRLHRLMCRVNVDYVSAHQF